MSHMKTTKTSAVRYWSQTVRPILTLLLTITAFRSAVADWNDVPTGSMKPTIIEGDRVYINKLAWDLKLPYTTWRLAQWDNPKRGDIAVFYSPKDGTRLIKRVIGLPGDQIEMNNETLLINGKPAQYTPFPTPTILPENEQHTSLFAAETIQNTKTHPIMTIPNRQALRSFGPITIPDNSYFMMGDNRDDSFDSRYFGPVPRNKILGRATAIVLSLDHNHYHLPRWNRFNTSLN
jgi:signal peptidase I